MSEIGKRTRALKQMDMTSSVKYEVYKVGQIVECKFEMRKDAKKVEHVWWAGVVVQVPAQVDDTTYLIISLSCRRPRPRSEF